MYASMALTPAPHMMSATPPLAKSAAYHCAPLTRFATRPSHATLATSNTVPADARDCEKTAITRGAADEQPKAER